MGSRVRQDSPRLGGHGRSARTWRGARRGVMVLAATGVCALVAACSGVSDADTRQAGAPQTPTSVAMNPDLHERLPADVRDRGHLRVGTEAGYPPMESFAGDGRTIIGVDPDLAAAIGERLGVAVTMENHPFDDLLGLVVGGRIDLVMSAMTDTVQREEQVDFINYFKAGTVIVVQRGNPGVITGLDSLCGHPVAVERGTTQVHLLDRQQDSCGDPIEVVETPSNDDALLLLRTARASAVLMDYPSAELLTTDPGTHGDYELAITAQYEPGLYGIAVAKERTDLRDVVRDALQDLHDSGVYERIMFQWGVAEGVVRTISINAAGGGEI